jgi:hypothetical protein
MALYLHRTVQTQNRRQGSFTQFKQSRLFVQGDWHRCLKRELKVCLSYLAINALASSADVKAPHLAVGMSCLAIKLLAQCLSDSIRAAALPGPKQSTPWARNTSAIPSARGCSGPTTTRLTFLCLLQEATAYTENRPSSRSHKHTSCKW